MKKVFSKNYVFAFSIALCLFAFSSCSEQAEQPKSETPTPVEASATPATTEGTSIKDSMDDGEDKTLTPSIKKEQ